MYRLGLAALVTLATAWTPVASTERAADEERDWEWEGRVDRGDALEIKGVNGDIHAERASGDAVEVLARLSGDDDDPDDIEMVVIEHQGGVTICALYPSPDRDEPNECRPGGRGRNNVRNNDVEVEFTVRVPAGVNFVGRTVNGEVYAGGIDGDVRAHTVNGDVDIYSSGFAEATTVNGSITASMQRADWSGTLDFTTVNGSVTLELPADLNCDVSISTVNGTISSDYPLTVEGRFSPRHLKGSIGDGGRTLVVKTVNGSVQLRRS